MKAASALAIGGIDPSGGAGLGMDRVTFAARGVWCRLVATAITAQDGRDFVGAWPVPAAALEAQLDAALADGTVTAIKIGMLPTAAAVDSVRRALELHPVDSVLDPVSRTSSGGELIDAEGRTALLRELIPRVSLLTPNLPEAAALLATPAAAVEADPAGAARALLAAGARAVLLKGGHGAGEEAVDWYVDSEHVLTFRTPRRPSSNTRGTGCSLASAIAAELALGRTLPAAVTAAKSWFDATFAAGSRFDFGATPGPLPVLGETLREPQAGGQGRSLRS